MQERLDEGEGSKSHSLVKNCTTKKLAKIAKRSKKHAMKIAAYPEKKVKFNQKIRNKIRGRRSRRRTLVPSEHMMINFNQ